MFSKDQINYCLDPHVLSQIRLLTNPQKIEFFLKSEPFRNFKGKFRTPYLSTMYSHFGVEPGTIRGRRAGKILNTKKPELKIKNENKKSFETKSEI